jgi:hypothetical protein
VIRRATGWSSMGNYWLYEEVLKKEPDRHPVFALQSTINWVLALEHEVTQRNGVSAVDQYVSCERLFRSNTQGGGHGIDLSSVFEPLFLCLVHSLSLVSRSVRGECPAWSLQGMIVEWYYAFYGAMRSMLAAANVSSTDNHTKTMNAVGGSLRRKLPHPLDMVATWRKNDEFQKLLPTTGTTKTEVLTGAFHPERAESMLLGFLSGTVKDGVENVKHRLKERRGIHDFRKFQDRKIRDDALRNREFNFMHCAFRLRGKANYRDAIYIAYGVRNVPCKREFVEALATTARFAFVCGLAFASLRIGKENVRKFVDDLTVNLRDCKLASEEECYWQFLPVGGARESLASRR